MDPSQKDSFDSLTSAGGAQPGGQSVQTGDAVLQPVVGQSAMGQPVAGGGAVMPQSAGEQPGQTGNSFVNTSMGTSTNMPVSTGTGDIILDNQTSEGNKKFVIILLIVLFLVGLVAGSIALWKGGLFGGRGNSSNVVSTVDLKEAYNTYVNYVFYGEDSPEKPDLEILLDSRPYFETIGVDEKDIYMESEKEKYDQLEPSFKNGYKGDNDFDESILHAFFGDMVGLEVWSDDEILKLYIDNGYEKARDMIMSRYNVNGGNMYFDSYLDAVEDLSLQILTVVKESDVAGCLQNGAIIEGCYSLTEDEDANLTAGITRMMSLRSSLYKRAIEVVEIIYSYLYGEVENE